MKNNKVLAVIIVLVLVIVVASSYFLLRSPWKFTEDRPIKVFILNSFHEEFPSGLVKGYIKGINEIFEKENIDYVVKIYSLDILRKNLAEEEIAVKEAKALIDEWQPDVLFTTDEDVQKLVVIPYYLNTDLPIVYLSLTKVLPEYGYIGSKNTTGVVENNHFVEAIDYLKALFPSVKKIAVIGDRVWEQYLNDLRKEEGDIEDIEFVGWHVTSEFSELKRLVLDYQDKVDAFLFSPAHLLKDEAGNPVTIHEVTQWIVENSNLPEISLWPVQGYLAIVTYSPYEQGKEAARIAQEILIDGKKPSSFDIRTTMISDRYLNLRRAGTLGLEREDIKSTILINSKLIESFVWWE